MRSLQSRLLLGTGTGFAVGLLLAGLATYFFTRLSLYTEYDRTLLTKARGLAALTNEQNDEIELDFSDNMFVEFVRTMRPAYYQLWLDDGSVLERSERLTTDLVRIESYLDEPQYASVRLPDGRRGRQIELLFHPRRILGRENHPFKSSEENIDEESDDELSHAVVTLVVAQDTANVDSRLAAFRWLLSAVGICVIICCMAYQFFAVKRGLHPLRMLASAISDICEDNLEERVDLKLAPPEVKSIIVRLNELLARMDLAFQRERALSLNLAHELRTPLAGLRTTIEVYLARPHENEEYQNSLQRCLIICQQSTEMVESLLSIAQFETGDVSLNAETIRIDTLLAECWAPLSAGAQEKGLQDFWRVPLIEIATDVEKLRMVVSNALRNAVSHGDVGGWLNVTAELQADTVRMTFENSGNILSSSQVKSVFERFWRGDISRTKTGNHFGLGLTITRRLTETLGGNVVADVEGSVFRLVLTLPSARLAVVNHCDLGRSGSLGKRQKARP